MKSRSYLIVMVVVLLVGVVGGRMFGMADSASAPSKLGVVWTSGDSEVAHKVCFMYAHNAKEAKWFDEVTLGDVVCDAHPDMERPSSSGNFRSS